jgi:hypothetical protein
VLLSNLDIQLHTQKLVWQPNSKIKIFRSYLLLQGFKYRSSKVWFGYGSVKSSLSMLIHEIKSLLNGSSQLQLSRQLLYVATVVSQKHVRSWEILMDLDLDAALILEDDAILNSERINVLKDALQEIASSQPIYINLAKANNLRSYRFSKFQSEKSSTQWLKALVADTSCAYLINRSSAEILLSEYRRSPRIDSLAIDFMTSDIFLRNQKIVVLHSETPPFVNGTLFGTYKSQTGARARDDW